MVISTNIGLSNIRKRLEILYPQKHTLNITNEDENYDCYLTLKLDTDHEKDSVYHS
jgi:two-component system, LytTR family, sensor kinase